MMRPTRLHELADLGQSPWIDALSRQALVDGELETLVRDRGVLGVTSNPTIFERAIASGDAYDDQLREIFDGGERDTARSHPAARGRHPGRV